MGMKPLTCLIIEDEPIAAEVIQDYINQVDFLELRGICPDAISAMERLHLEPIDVLFLDIHLPKLKGLDFLRSLRQQPQTILTTAYHDYALDAFEEDVIDYLMKPIPFARFLKAVNKLSRHQAAGPTPPSPQAPTEHPFHFFNVNKQKVKVFYNEILYVESLKDYSKIVAIKDNIVTRGQIGEMEALLQPHGFLRIHRSFLINTAHIRAYSATDITIQTIQLPIGRSYKGLVMQVLNAIT